MITRLLLVSAPILGFTTASGPLRPVVNILLLVFLALGCVWLFLEIRRQLSADVSAGPAPAASPRPAAVEAAPAVPEGISPAVLAVIAAAVHSTLGHGARVVAVSPAASLPGTAPLSWSAEGRRAHYSSHKVR